jgi:uncharacterized membrane protein
MVYYNRARLTVISIALFMVFLVISSYTTTMINHFKEFAEAGKTYADAASVLTMEAATDGVTMYEEVCGKPF